MLSFETSLDVSVVSFYYKKVTLERKAKFAGYNVMDEEYPKVSSCLAGNSLIQTIDGPVRIKDLVGKDEVIVFSYDGVIKKILLARTTGGAVKTRQREESRRFAEFPLLTKGVRLLFFKELTCYNF